MRAGRSCNMVDRAVDELYVAFSTELLRIVPGRVSVEIDADLSFDTCASLAKAHRLLDLFQAKGVSSDRILIKLATTWEGLQACRVLESQGIHCNMTLMFHLWQAAAASQLAGATVISPFVGRISEWYLKNTEATSFNRNNDPGVDAVVDIYQYLKRMDSKTQILAAALRNPDQVLSLSGCDMMTLPPNVLDQLANMKEPVDKMLDARRVKMLRNFVPRIEVDERSFRWQMNEDPMATDKLAEGLRGFSSDTKMLKKLVAGMLSKN